MESQTRSKGGRPTKYKPEFADLLIAHFEEYLREPERQVLIGRKKFYGKNGIEREEEVYKPVPKPIPTLFAFSRKIKVDYDTVLRWSSKRIGVAPDDGQPDRRPYAYPEFCGAYKLAVHFQIEAFNTVGIGGTAPSAFTIFAAKNMIRWRDDQYVGALNRKGQPTNASGGYILIPNRLTDSEAKEEYDTKQQEEVSISS